MQGFNFVANKLNKDTKRGGAARLKALNNKLRELEKSRRVAKPAKASTKGASMASLHNVDMLKSVPKAVRRMVVNTDTAFAKALQNPFSEKSFGCRVPDTYSFPTSTHHCRSVSNFTSSASGQLGALFMPNPIITMLDTVPFVTGSATTTSLGASGSGMPRIPGWPSSSFNYSVYGAATQTICGEFTATIELLLLG